MKKANIFNSIIILFLILFSAGCAKQSGAYKIINISDDKTMIQEMPDSANEGDTITVKIAAVTDAISYVRVNENPDFGKFIDPETYVFVMPAEDVAVKAGFTTNDWQFSEESEAAPEPSAAPKPSEAPSSSSDDTFDIFDNLYVTSTDGITYIYGNDFLLTMPENDVWAYEQTANNAFTIYHVAAKKAGYGGELVSIAAYDLDDTSYQNHPHYQEAGIGQTIQKRFVAFYPTDVRYDGNDQEQRESYQDLYTYLSKISGSAVNSPFQTSDSD